MQNSVEIRYSSQLARLTIAVLFVLNAAARLDSMLQISVTVRVPSSVIYPILSTATLGDTDLKLAMRYPKWFSASCLRVKSYRYAAYPRQFPLQCN